MITPEKLRFELKYNNITIDITNDVSNWDDIKISFSRDDLKGVYIDITSAIEFIGDTYDLLDSLYTANSFRTEAQFIISLRNDTLDANKTLWTYSEYKRVDLDFSTYKREDTVISLNAKSNSLADLIKANKGTTYDIPESELDGAIAGFSYDRLALQNSLSVIPSVDDSAIQDEDGLSYRFVSQSNIDAINDIIPIAADASEIYNSDIAYIGDYSSLVTGHPVIHIKKGTIAYIEGSFKVERTLFPGQSESTPSTLWISVKTIGSNAPDATKQGFGTTNLTYNGETKTFSIAKTQITTDVDIKLIIEANLESTYDTKVYTTFSDFSMKVTYESKYLPVTFNIKTLSSLLQKLIDKMCGTGFTATIDTGVTNTIVVSCAEGIRGFTSPKFHVSFNNFYNSMKAVFGLDYDISGTTIAFKPKAQLFQNVKALDIENVTDLQLTVNTTYLYPNVKIGFNKTDYNKVNGKDEFRFTNQFTTGVTVSDKALELVSDFRADAWGIEFLVQQRGEDTTDDESDDDVFLLDVSLQIIVPGDLPIYGYRPNRSYTLTGVLSPSTMFNAFFSPRMCLLRNIKHLGICTSNLTFSSSEGNSDVTINGYKETDSITITERLFSPDKLKFKIGKIPAIPVDKNGYIEFTYKGTVYQGYIDELEHYIGKDQQTSWKLFCKQKQDIVNMYIDNNSELLTTLDTDTTMEINDSYELVATLADDATDDYAINDEGGLILTY